MIRRKKCVTLRKKFMAKKKKQSQGGGQQFLSPEQYVRQRVRTLPMGKCYITDTLLDVGGMCHVVVTRQHNGGRISMALFMVDMFCVGVKESFYRLRLEPKELDDMLDTGGVGFSFNECSYEEAHNRIYGAIAFAEEGGIKPDKSFLLTKYFLEEDTDDIPIIDYEYGKNGKHLLVCDSELEASKYLPALRKTLGEDGFTYIIGYENIDDELDDGSELLSPGPVYMSELVRCISYEDLYAYAETLYLDIEENLNLPQLRQAYIDEVLDSPQMVLSQFSREDLYRLKELADQPEWGDELPFYDGCITPLMVHYGFAEEGWKDDIHYVVRIARDFREAVMPYLDEVLNSEVTDVRIMVESVVEGLANLYGEVNRKEAVEFIKKNVLTDMKVPVEDVFDEVWRHSMQLDWMVQPVEDNGKSFLELPDEEIIFSSRYGWDDNDALHQAIKQHSPHVMHRHPFNDEQVFAASRSGLPKIPNSRQQQFETFLAEKLDIDEAETAIICYDLWLRAQHEGDEDFEDDTWNAYFNEIVLDDKDDQLKEEATRELKAYMDCMPRWTLKGYAPCEMPSSNSNGTVKVIG